MRILHVISAFQLGGAEEIAIGLAEGLSARGHESFVAAVGRARFKDDIGARQTDQLAEAGIPFATLGGKSSRLNVLHVPFKLANLVRKWKPDIVHSHTDMPDLMVSLALRIIRFRVARTIHNSELWPAHKLMGRLSESAFEDDMVVSVSADAQSAYEALRGRYQLPVSSCHSVIKNAVRVRLNDEPPDKSRLAELFGAAEDKVQFCFAGRFNYQKGFDILIEAIAGLPAADLDSLELHAFGTGKELQTYRTIVSQKNLPIRFHKPIPHISDLFPAFDAVLMPSRYEGLALVALESLAAGVPVIGTLSKGLRESVPPDWPLLAVPEDPEAYQKLLKRFLDSEFQIEALKEKALSWVSGGYEIRSMIDGYQKAYCDYLKAPSSSKFSTVYVFGIARISFPNSTKRKTRRLAQNLYQPFSHFRRAIYKVWQKIPFQTSVLYLKTDHGVPRLAEFNWRNWVVSVAVDLKVNSLTPLFYFPPQKGEQKAVVVLADITESPVACAKIGLDIQSKSSVKKEITAFDYLEKFEFESFNIPRKLSAGAWGNASYLVITYEEGQQSVSYDWTAPHTRIWREFVGKTSQASRLKEQVWEDLPPLWQDLRRRLEGEAGGEQYLHCAIHGDMAPWNILRSEDRLVLIDWEHFSPSAPYFSDPAHYVLSVHLRARKKSAKLCAQALLGLSNSLSVSREDVAISLAYIASQKDWPGDMIHDVASIVLDGPS